MVYYVGAWEYPCSNHMKYKEELVFQTTMKKMKRVIPLMMAAVLASASVPAVAMADSSKVVTLGANLSSEQKTSMYKYFGTTSDSVETIEVTNTDERKYMEGIASEAQIGTRTFSCSYVEPTTSGGVQVKVANLTFVTSSMIASTLLTSGVENCNVVAASPIEVSGTGALTGIMMAYETASGEQLSEEQKAAATEELVTTGDIANSVGQKEAADLMNDVKENVIEDGLKDEGEIQEAVDDAASDVGVSLTDEQKQRIVALMQTISQYDYDVNALKDTLNNIEGKSDGFFSNIWQSIKGVFTGGDSAGGIINDTKDDILGAGAVIDSTLDGQKGEGIWDKITGFFKGLFSGEDEEKAEKVEDTADVEDTTDIEDVQEDETDTNDTELEENTDGTDNKDDISGTETPAQDTVQDGTNDSSQGIPEAK